MSGLKYWLWLTSRKGMDPISALTVLDHFITPERAYYAEPEDFYWTKLSLSPLPTPKARHTICHIRNYS